MPRTDGSHQIQPIENIDTFNRCRADNVKGKIEMVKLSANNITNLQGLIAQACGHIHIDPRSCRCIMPPVTESVKKRVAVQLR